MMSNLAIGIDFGTTNSVVSVCDDQGQVRTARFDWPGGASETFRSILCFWQEKSDLHHKSGQAAIEEYLKDTADSRFIQSIKTYLGSELFTETRLFSTRFTLDDLIALLLRGLWQRASAALGLDPDPSVYAVVSGRPVKFAGADPNEDLAVHRLGLAYQQAGFGRVTFAYEPEGAAFWFARQHPDRARILVADFGGGTSDFSVVEVHHGDVRPLGSLGIGVAGDILDFRLIDHVVAPALGKGSTYESFGKTMPVPFSYYHHFSSWHLLSLLKTPKVVREIEEITRTAHQPKALKQLLCMIEHELGFKLYRAINRTKVDLSSRHETEFVFVEPGINIRKAVTRRDFEGWIADDLAAMERTVDQLLKLIGLAAPDIDHIFMTGGTSFVPAVRDMMAQKFGAEKISAGDEFTSVSAGLAMIAWERYRSSQGDM